MPATSTASPVASEAAKPCWGAGVWRERCLAVALVLGVLVAYLPVFRAGFVWDDDAHVTRAALQSLHGLRRIWTEVGATQQFYPLLHSCFWLEHRLWGDAPLGYHLVNVLLHAGNALLLVAVLRRLAIPGAWLAAAVFALHPVQVESVAWVSEQKNTLSLLLGLAAVLAYLRSEEQRRARRASSPNSGGREAAAMSPGAWYGAALVLFVGSLLTKSVTAVLPAVLLVIAWWRRGRVSLRDDVLPLLPWFAAAVMAGLLTASVERTMIGADGAAFVLSPLQHVLLATRAAWFYLGKLCWPAPLMFIYPRWTLDPTAVAQWIPLAATVGVLVVLWRVRRRTRAPLAAALTFGGALFPALGFFHVFPFLYSYVADHFQYLATLCPITLAGAGAALLAARIGRGPVTAGGLLLIAVLGVLTWRQAGTYRDAETLYRATLRANPGCWMAENNLGKLLMSRRETLPEAIAHFEAALRLNPPYAEAENNLGLALIESGRPALAVPHLESALRLRPEFYQAHNNLGIALAKLGDVDRAICEFARAATLAPGLPNAQENWGKALLLAGRRDEAQRHFERAAQLRAEAAGELAPGAP